MTSSPSPLRRESSGRRSTSTADPSTSVSLSSSSVGLPPRRPLVSAPLLVLAAASAYSAFVVMTSMSVGKRWADAGEGRTIATVSAEYAADDESDFPSSFLSKRDQQPTPPRPFLKEGAESWPSVTEECSAEGHGLGYDGLSTPRNVCGGAEGGNGDISKGGGGISCFHRRLEYPENFCAGYGLRMDLNAFSEYLGEGRTSTVKMGRQRLSEGPGRPPHQRRFRGGGRLRRRLMDYRVRGPIKGVFRHPNCPKEPTWSASEFGSGGSRLIFEGLETNTRATKAVTARNVTVPLSGGNRNEDGEVHRLEERRSDDGHFGSDDDSSSCVIEDDLVIVLAESYGEGNPWHELEQVLNAYETMAFHDASALTARVVAFDAPRTMTDVASTLMPVYGDLLRRMFTESYRDPSVPGLQSMAEYVDEKRRRAAEAAAGFDAEGLPSLPPRPASCVEFRQILFVPHGGSSALNRSRGKKSRCSPSPLIQNFVKFVLSRVPEAEDVDATRVTIIVRGPEANRRVVDPAYREMARKFRGRPGVDVVNFSKLDIVSQIRQARSSRLMVAQHGAALTHALWMRPGTEVWEVGRKQCQCFKNIASWRLLRHSSHSSRSNVAERVEDFIAGRP